MSFQQARLDIQAAIESIVVTEDAWVVTADTEPDIHHKTIVVGHASLIEADTFESFVGSLVVTVWVSEADDASAVDVMYDLVSPGAGSLLTALPTTFPVAGKIRTPRVRDVGRRDEGPSGFLAADIEIELFGY